MILLIVALLIAVFVITIGLSLLIHKSRKAGNGENVLWTWMFGDWGSSQNSDSSHHHHSQDGSSHHHHPDAGGGSHGGFGGGHHGGFDGGGHSGGHH